MVALFRHLFLFLCLFSFAVQADEYMNDDQVDNVIYQAADDAQADDLLGQLAQKGHFAVRLNEKGWHKVLDMALQFGIPKAKATYTVKGNIYELKIAKNLITKNPIVPIINEITNLGLEKEKRDIKFYFETSDIDIVGNVDKKSLKVEFSRSHADGFDVSLSISIPSIALSSQNMSLCLEKKKGKCSDSLKATIKKLSIKTKTNPIRLNAKLRLLNKNGLATVKLLSVTTNLEGKGAPTLDINFADLIMPGIFLEIDGESIEIATDTWGNELKKHKVFLAKELMKFAADYAGKNLARMINVYLVNTQVKTEWKLLDVDNTKNFNELTFEDEFQIPAQKSDSNYVAPAVDPNKVDYMKLMMNQINEVIEKARVDLSLHSIKMPANKDIELTAAVGLMLNGRNYSIQPYIHNSENRITGYERIVQEPRDPRLPVQDNTYVRKPEFMPKVTLEPLPVLDLSAHRLNDINIALSEPLINGTIDLINSTGLIHKIFAAAVKDHPELSLDKQMPIRIHISKKRNLSLVLNLHLNMGKIRNQSFKNWIGNAIEWVNGNNTDIRFPVEIEIVPSIRQDPTCAELVLFVKSPMADSALVNNWGYYSNVKNMVGKVRSGLMDKLNEAFKPHVNKEYAIDIKQHLNQSGVEFTPKSITFDRDAYMILNLDLKDIKFNRSVPNKK